MSSAITAKCCGGLLCAWDIKRRRWCTHMYTYTHLGLRGGLLEAGPAGGGRRLQQTVLINHAVLKLSQLSTQPSTSLRARCANKMGFSADGRGIKGPCWMVKKWRPGLGRKWEQLHSELRSLARDWSRLKIKTKKQKNNLADSGCVFSEMCWNV